MKNYILKLLFFMSSAGLLAQAGHIIPGVGAVNMAMGGAATAQPIDINGPLQWNPAGISFFDQKILSVNFGLFFSSPKLSSTIPTLEGPYTGVTEDERGALILPALAMVFGNEESNHTFGVSFFGISGFGVTFPENLKNPINLPQQIGGLGRLESDYLLLQVGLTYAYEINDRLSIGLVPTFNYAAMKLTPNPLAPPDLRLRYPASRQASAMGYGGQAGIFYQSESGLNLGVSYKSPQFFSDFDFKNTYLDQSAAPNQRFNLDYPAIYSVGLGYTLAFFDFAFDYRYVDYDHTDGFKNIGWTEMDAVVGLGWKSISMISAGLQFKGIKNIPLRIGYTYSDNPITEDLAFFSTLATAIIQNAFQVGVGFEVGNSLVFNLTYHHGESKGATEGPLLSPFSRSENNPLGKIPNSKVSYDMTVDLVMLGVNYTFRK